LYAGGGGATLTPVLRLYISWALDSVRSHLEIVAQSILRLYRLKSEVFEVRSEESRCASWAEACRYLAMRPGCPSQLGFERNKWRRLGGNSRLHIRACWGEKSIIIREFCRAESRFATCQDITYHVHKHCSKEKRILINPE
jgi:hypothetical protein